MKARSQTNAHLDPVGTQIGGYTVIERTTSTDQVVAGVAWAVTVLVYVVAGLFLLHGAWKGAIFIAEVACGLSAYAAVRHLKCYAVRICGLVRRVDQRVAGREAEVPLQRIH